MSERQGKVRQGGRTVHHWVLTPLRHFFHPVFDIELEHIDRYPTAWFERGFPLADRLDEGLSKGTMPIPLFVFAGELGAS
jgi:hypothetical protein